MFYSCSVYCFSGHFLLTNLLLDDLKQTAKDGGDARIVVVSSGLHDTDFAKKKGRESTIIICIIYPQNSLQMQVQNSNQHVQTK